MTAAPAPDRAGADGVPERVLVQARLSKELVRAVDHLAVDDELTRQGMIERLLREALDQRRR